MANEVIPYQVGANWTIDIDPDDINFVVWDVSKDLSDRATSIATAGAGVVPVTLLLTGMTASQGPTAQGTSVIALLKASDAVKANPHSATARILCANGEQFDRTISFNLEDH